MTAPCVCDPELLCEELDCHGCECTTGSCASCRPQAVPARRRIDPADAERWAIPCTVCARPTLTKSQRDALPVEERARYQEHRVRGACCSCASRRVVRRG